MLFGARLDARQAVQHGLVLRVAEDPVAAAIELAAGPASAPRQVVLATKATMRATASPGSIDTDLHDLAKRVELGPQATSIRSPEFAQRLAAAKAR
jgi:enoyl-CoA hydratase